MKRLTRSDRNRVLVGLCGGIGEYFEVDPVLIRLLWVVASVFTGLVPGLLAYLVAAFVVPGKNQIHHGEDEKE